MDGQAWKGYIYRPEIWRHRAHIGGAGGTVTLTVLHLFIYLVMIYQLAVSSSVVGWAWEVKCHYNLADPKVKSSRERNYFK